MVETFSGAVCVSATFAGHWCLDPRVFSSPSTTVNNSKLLKNRQKIQLEPPRRHTPYVHLCDKGLNDRGSCTQRKGFLPVIAVAAISSSCPHFTTLFLSPGVSKCHPLNRIYQLHLTLLLPNSRPHCTHSQLVSR